MRAQKLNKAIWKIIIAGVADQGSTADLPLKDASAKTVHVAVVALANTFAHIVSTFVRSRKQYQSG